MEDEVYTTEDVVKFVKALIKCVREERATLEGVGLDVDFILKTLEEDVQMVEDSKACLEEMRKEYAVCVSQSVISKNAPSRTSTIHLDMAADSFRKDGDVIKHFESRRREYNRWMRWCKSEVDAIRTERSLN